MLRQMEKHKAYVQIKGQNQYRFYVDDKLGKGGFGVVYKGQKIIHSEENNQKNYQIVAIKQYIQSAQKRSSIENQREYTILKMISERHDSDYQYKKNIVRCEQYFKYNHKYYLILEYCDGDTLQKILKKPQKITQNFVQATIQGLIKGLYFLHYLSQSYKFRKIQNTYVYKKQEKMEKGIFHRDLKPSNILFNQQEVKIIDFGFAKISQNKNEVNKHTYCGTRAYQSPEIITNSLFNMKSDIWSLGIIIYQLLFGRRPYTKYEKVHIIEKAKKLVKMIQQKDFQKQVKINEFTGKYVSLWKQILIGCLTYNHSQRKSSKQLHDILIFHKMSQVFQLKITKQSTEEIKIKKFIIRFQKIQINHMMDYFTSQKNFTNNLLFLRVAFLSLTLFLNENYQYFQSSQQLKQTKNIYQYHQNKIQNFLRNANNLQQLDNLYNAKNKLKNILQKQFSKIQDQKNKSMVRIILFLYIQVKIFSENKILTYVIQSNQVQQSTKCSKQEKQSKDIINQLYQQNKIYPLIKRQIDSLIKMILKIKKSTTQSFASYSYKNSSI